MQTFGIAEISQRLRNADFSVFLPFGEFLGLADAESIIVGSEREKAEQVLEAKRWPGNEARIGSTGVFPQREMLGRRLPGSARKV